MAFSSEISIIRENSTILISGEITEGDYQKFEKAKLEGPGVEAVYISSPGGNALEAMKIGHLIRELGLSTQIPFNANGSPICPRDTVRLEECTCLSACSLLYLSGVYRLGDYIGVHRFYIDKNIVKNMTLQESSKATVALSASLEEYLREMGAPKDLHDRMFAKSADEIEVLETVYVDKYLGGFIPEYQDWLSAKCGGDSKALINQMTESKEQYQALEPKLDQISQCENKLLLEDRWVKYLKFQDKHPIIIREDDQPLLSKEQVQELKKLLKK